MLALLFPFLEILFVKHGMTWVGRIHSLALVDPHGEGKICDMEFQPQSLLPPCAGGLSSHLATVYSLPQMAVG